MLINDNDEKNFLTFYTELQFLYYFNNSIIKTRFLMMIYKIMIINIDFVQLI